MSSQGSGMQCTGLHLHDRLPYHVQYPFHSLFSSTGLANRSRKHNRCRERLCEHRIWFLFNESTSPRRVLRYSTTSPNVNKNKSILLLYYGDILCTKSVLHVVFLTNTSLHGWSLRDPVNPLHQVWERLHIFFRQTRE